MYDWLTDVVDFAVSNAGAGQLETVAFSDGWWVPNINEK